MAIKLFGFKIGREETEAEAQQQPSFALPENEDGAITVQPTYAAGGAYGQYLDLEGAAKSEAELVSRYREMVIYPECNFAVEDIVNESLIVSEDKRPVSILLDNLKQSDTIKNKIKDEFENILQLLDFEDYCFDIFKRWYVDGRLYYHIIIDVKNPNAGIKELRSIDPRKIRKVREIRRTKTSANLGTNGTPLIRDPKEFFIFNENGFDQKQGKEIKIARDSICHIHSGIVNTKKNMVLSHLHQAIKPYNQLRMLEDAVVIYRISRAPERRIFYVDVGNLPKIKAEQYLRDVMTKFKNRLVYDAETGAIRDDRTHRTMLEDYWLPRREGGRGTEITTLPGGQNLGEIEDVQYFRKKLYQALRVPSSRLESETGFNIGRSAEITRDEVKFGKFITRLRHRFNQLFLELLETQLRLKGVLTKEDWSEFKSDIRFDYLKDTHFMELQEAEIFRNRIELLRDMEEYKGMYFSAEYLRKNILHQTDDEIEEIESQLNAEPDPELLSPDGMPADRMAPPEAPEPAAAPAPAPKPAPKPAKNNGKEEN
tara:strand:+ start:1127 stop:2749 length:1623 start_codon:yes stop_codon:yes gene_type:complete